mmetsp:Transcript_15264/g.19353  ORF Transcript_15264/g.19353 Transcript_15264/m.19353 type:complete len:83 (+) Transcript_15264:10-258(+)
MYSINFLYLQLVSYETFLTLELNQSISLTAFYGLPFPVFQGLFTIALCAIYYHHLYKQRLDSELNASIPIEDQIAIVKTESV